MTIFLVEPSDKGHQPHYVNVCVQALVELGCRVVSVIPENGTEYSTLTANRNHTRVNYPRFRTFKGRGGGLLTRWSRVISEIRACKSHVNIGISDRPLIYKPTMHYCDIRNCKVVYDFCRQDWSGLYINASELRRGYPDSYQKKVVSSLYNSKSCKHLFSNDLGVLEQLGTLVSAQVGYFPEVVSRYDISRVLDIPEVLMAMYRAVEGQTIITHAGMLTKRKGVMNFIQAIQSITSPNVVFNIVGPVSLAEFTVDEQKYIENVWASDPRVRLFRQSVASDIFEWVIERSDLVFAVYEDWTQGSSVLTHASHARVPSIVAGGSCMGDLCEKYNLGWVVDPSTTIDYSGIYSDFAECRHDNRFEFQAHLQLQSYENVKIAMERLLSR